MWSRLILAFLWLAASSAYADTVSDAVLQKDASKLEEESARIRARLQALGRAPTSQDAIRNLRSDIRVFDEKDARLAEAIDRHAADSKSLVELQKSVREGKAASLEDVIKDKLKNEATGRIENALKSMGRRSAGKVVGWADLLIEAGEKGVTRLIRHIDAHALNEAIVRHEVTLKDLAYLLSAIRQERNSALAKIAEIEALHKQQQRILNELAMLNNASKSADTDRETDAAGDQVLLDEELNATNRLCDPSQRKLRGRVRQSSGEAHGNNSGTIVGHQKPCKPIDGPWRLTWDSTKLTADYEVIYTGPLETGPGADATYNFTPKGGWNVRCKAKNFQLQCEFQTPSQFMQRCPGALPAWDRFWEMDVKQDGPFIEGYFQPTHVFAGPGKCDVITMDTMPRQKFRLTRIWTLKDLPQ